ncbi:MAG: carbohydrate kinase family protein [Anaerolineae bacterium]|nr:carbohydrate kinase family protein [Candidatus Roseilinea sp.]MDW8449238.1 carbohydrate kinase family protein [Anaerolineae bacterium]
MNIVVTGSIAYDYLMTFPGSFSEHILPEHMARVSLSFLVDSMERRRGGCGPNIAYTLALLGERPRLMGTAGQDFDEYREWLESVGVDTSLTRIVRHKFTASFFCSTDRNNNQIASFYSGAMADARELSFKDLPFKPDIVIISPNDPQAMIQHARECRELGIRHIFDPGQQVARSSGEELKAGIVGADILICNDYEFELIRQKTGLTEADVLYHSEALVITRGEKGSTILLRDHRIDIPAVPEERVVDPTGVGDAFRGGLLKGLAVGADWETCGRLGSVAATFALEHIGGQGHSYTWEQFKARYEAHFGPLNIEMNGKLPAGQRS